MDVIQVVGANQGGSLQIRRTMCQNCWSSQFNFHLAGNVLSCAHDYMRATNKCSWVELITRLASDYENEFLREEHRCLLSAWEN